jgi:hypothetical protein
MAKAGVRQKEAASGPPPGVATKSRKPEELIELWLEAESLESLGTVTTEELYAMIDFGAEVDERRKAMEAEVKKKVEPLKKLLLKMAERDKWRHKVGKYGKCDVTRGSKTIMGTPTELARLLKKEGKINLFDALVGVKVSETKKYIGEDALKGFMQVEPVEYGSVSLKKL